MTEWCSGQARWAHNPKVRSSNPRSVVFKFEDVLERDSVEGSTRREEDVVHQLLGRVFRRRCRDVLVSQIQTFGPRNV